MSKIRANVTALTVAAGAALAIGVAAPAGAHSTSGVAPARRWLTTVTADGRHSMYGIVRSRHPRYSSRQVGDEATATRNRFYVGRSIYTVIPRGRRVTIYV